MFGIPVVESKTLILNESYGFNFSRSFSLYSINLIIPFGWDSEVTTLDEVGFAHLQKHYLTC